MPILIFIHGLLGTKADWKKVIEKLPHFQCFSLDLPLHGDAGAINVNNFDDTCVYLATQIKSAVGNSPHFLIGYSLGARIALYYTLCAQGNNGNLQGLVLEGVNLGLSNEKERRSRWLSDQKWAQRFSNEPMDSVLQDWYQQPVFAHLNNRQRLEVIRKRNENCGTNIARMLLATSLAKQPDFRTKVRSSSVPIYYIVGEKDQKFKEIALANQLDLIMIENAGHNTHVENPQKFAEKLTTLVNILTHQIKTVEL